MSGDIRVDIKEWKAGIQQCDVYVDGIHVFSGVQWAALATELGKAPNSIPDSEKKKYKEALRTAKVYIDCTCVQSSGTIIAFNTACPHFGRHG